MDSDEPTQRPVVEWTLPPEPPPPGTGLPTGELFRGKAPGDLTLSDAISTGFRVLMIPSFIVPILIVGVIVNVVVGIVFGPLIIGMSPGSSFGPAELQAQMGSVIGGFIVALVGSVLVGLYGSIWAVAASSGPLPSYSAVVELMGKRWVGIIGTGLVVALLLTVAFVGVGIVGGTVGVLLGQLGIIVFIAMFVLLAWIGLRLSLAVWLAAEGGSVASSISGSWAMTKGNVLRLFGWTIAYGLVFAIVLAILGIGLNLVPVVGPAIGATLSLALGYGAGVTLYRRTQAAARA